MKQENHNEMASQCAKHTQVGNWNKDIPMQLHLQGHTEAKATNNITKYIIHDGMCT